MPYRDGTGINVSFILVQCLRSCPSINGSFIDINASSGMVISPVVYRGFPSSGGGRGWFSGYTYLGT
jgi:hypothetical protein